MEKYKNSKFYTIAYAIIGRQCGQMNGKAVSWESATSKSAEKAYVFLSTLNQRVMM